MLGGKIKTEEDRLAEVQAANNALTAQIAELQQFADLDAEVQQKRTALQTVMNGDVDWPALLTELAMVVPSDVWLTNLTASAGATEGATQVGTEANPVRISDEPAVGRIQFTGKRTDHAGRCEVADQARHRQQVRRDLVELRHRIGRRRWMMALRSS